MIQQRLAALAALFALSAMPAGAQQAPAGTYDWGCPEHVGTRAQMQAATAGMPIAPPVNVLVVGPNNLLRWNGRVLQSLDRLDVFFDVMAGMTPAPYLIIEVRQGNSAALMHTLREKVSGSGICRH